MFKILVCGSRDIKDKEYVFKILDFLLSQKILSDVILIHGGQKSYDKSTDTYFGADYLADLWGKERNVKTEVFPAPWDGLEDTPKSAMKKNRFGKLYWPGAGMYRNKQMANEKPDACVGFLGKNSQNRGTNNMLKLCQDNDILTKEYYI